MPLPQQEQTRQPQQSPDHSPAPTGGGYSSPPPLPTLPIRTPSPSGTGKSKGLNISLGKVSLFSIFFSVMIMGALTFLSGFLLGMWLAGPSTPTTYQAAIPSPQPLFTQQTPQAAPAPSLENQAFQALAGQAGYATQSAISNATVPGVPSFLAPLVSATQTAVGQQLGYKAQQQVNRALAPQTVSPTARTAPPKRPGEYTPPLTHPTPSTQPTPSMGHPQQAAPSGASSHTPSPASQLHNGDYTIQLGVYASKENADNLVNNLQGLNINARTTAGKDGEGNTVYLVQSGLYKDYNQALEAASQFATQNIPGATVVKVSQENKSGS